MASKNSKNKKTTTRKKAASKQPQKDNSLYKEAAVILAFGVSILLLISNFGLGGYVGGKVSGAMFGIFGLIAYIIPVILFVLTAFVVSNRSNSVAYVKVAAGIVAVMCICSVLQLLLYGYDKSTEIYVFYQYARDHKTAGGLIGGVITKMFCPAFGLAGTYIILILLLIVSGILISEKSLLRQLEKRRISQKKNRRTVSVEKDRLQKRDQDGGSDNTYVNTPDHSRTAGHGAARREDHKVHGVSMDTTLKKMKKPEVRELHSPNLPDADIDSNSPENSGNRKDELHIKRAVPVTGTEEKDAAAAELPENTKTRRARKTKESRAQADEEAVKIQEELEQKHSESESGYHLPPLSLLNKGKPGSAGDSDAYLQEMAAKLENTLQNFGVGVKITDVSCGPSVTRYELQPDQGVKVSRIVGLADDIKLNLAAPDIRIEAPIPGKAAVGIEVPNKEKSPVMLRDMLEEPVFQRSKSRLSFVVGRDIAGKTIVGDIQKMPHILIAGTTGSGKSVFINTLVMSILFKATPDEVKLIMIDPKVVEFKVYNGIPHLMIPVVTDPKKAAGALNWAVTEMTRRYQIFAEYNVRDLKGYNARVDSIQDINDENKPKKLPQIVIVVDELADLMMVSPGEVEEAICRLAQLARAAGIHLVIATQRPSVNVITGLIKANMPSRIALSVSSGVDSRTIIDMNGAEKLLGNGDMLYYPSGYQKPVRIQGGYVSDEEVQAVTEYLCKYSTDENYSNEIEEQVNSCIGASVKAGMDSSGESDRDVYFEKAARIIVDKDKASIGMLQRSLKIGFNRAARIMDQLCEAGVVGEEEGTKPRKVLMSMEQLEQYIDEYI